MTHHFVAAFFHSDALAKTKHRTHDWIACAIILVIWAFLYQDWLVGKRVIPWDAMTYFFPSMKFIVDSIKSGMLPFWNPYLLSGYPSVSDPQAGTFSILAIALLSFPEELTVRWFDTVIILHGAFGAIGIYFIARSYQLSPFASIIGALVFLCGGVSASRMQHVTMVLSYSYFPWTFLFLKKTLDSANYRHALLFGILTGFLSVHENHVTYLFSIILLAYFFYRIIESPTRWNFFKSRICPITLGGIIALLVAVPQIFATLFLYLPYTNRPAIDYQAAALNSLKPSGLLTLIFPDIFSNLSPTEYWGSIDVTETYFYIGCIPGVLLLQALYKKRQIDKKKCIFFALTAFICVLYMIGKYTPFYKIVFHYFPGVELFRRPSDAAFPLNFSLALIIAASADGILNKRERYQSVFFSLLSIALPIFLSIAMLWTFIIANGSGRIEKLITNVLTTGVLLTSAYILLTVFKSTQNVFARTGLGILIIFAITIDFHHHNIPNELNGHFPGQSLQFDESDHLVQYLKNNLDLTGKDGGPYRVEIAWAWPAWWNGPAVFGIHSTQGSNPLHYALYEEFSGVRPRMFGPPTKFTDFIPSYNAPLFNLLSAKYILSAKDIEELDPSVDTDSFPLVKTYGSIKIYENQNVLPRVLTFSNATFASSDRKARELLTSTSFNPRIDLVLQDLPSNLATSIDSSGNDASTVTLGNIPGTIARITRYKNNEVHIAIDAKSDTFLVLNDLLFPGWYVRVDGMMEEILRANYAFRAVYVRKGKHDVVFEFRPFSLDTIIRETGQ